MSACSNIIIIYKVNIAKDTCSTHRWILAVTEL